MDDYQIIGLIGLKQNEEYILCDNLGRVINMSEQI